MDTDVTIVTGKSIFQSHNVHIAAFCHYIFYQSVMELLIALKSIYYVPDASFHVLIYLLYSSIIRILEGPAY